jgi:molybdenum cofactor guanylyltransferase
MCKLSEVTVIILAGGQSSRMGGQDKGLLPISKRPMIEHILKLITPVTNNIVINANNNQAEYERYGYPVITDTIAGFPGPLAGILAGLIHCKTDFIITLPCDSPHPAADYIPRMITGLSKTTPCTASIEDSMQPVFSAIPKVLETNLQQYLEQGGRAVGKWLRQNNTTTIDFSDCPDAFFNINRPDDLVTFNKIRDQQ